MCDTAVILINYNGLSDTIECIGSIHLSTLHTDIIIVDNSVTMHDYYELKQIKDINVLRPGENLGFAGGNNYGIKYALECGYNYIILLNNDTIVDSKMLELLIENCDEHTVSLPVMYYYNSEKIWYAGGETNRYLGVAKHYGQIKSKKEYYCTYATGCCLAARAEVYKDLGYLNEKYFMYCEDFDYSIRLIKQQYKIKIVPDALLFHKIGASTKTVSDIAVYYNVRNRILLIKDNPDFFFSTAIAYTYLTRWLHLVFYRFVNPRKYKIYKLGYLDGVNKISGKKEM